MHSLFLPDPGEPRYCGRCAHPLEARRDGGRPRPSCPACGWTYYAKPALGAAALVENEGRILLVQRRNEPFRGWWMLPAGFVEYGEDAGETAAREAEEETGLLVQIERCQGIFFGGGDPRGASHLAVFGARLLGGALAAGDDAADAQWFNKDEIPDRIAFEAHRKALHQWLKGGASSAHDHPLIWYAGSGPAAPVVVYVIIENPKGTVDRIAYDPEVSDFVPSGEIFSSPLPIHYGFIPRTVSAGDGRELDVVVVGEGETSIGSVVAARPIGALLRADLDHKVLAIRADFPSAYATVIDAEQRPELREMVEGLFRTRATLTGWASPAETRRLILECQRAWVGSKRAGS